MKRFLTSFPRSISSSLGLRKLSWIKYDYVRINTYSLSLSLLLTCWLLLGGCTGRCSGWRSTNRQFVHHQLQLFSWRSGRRWLDLLGATGSRDRRAIQSRQSFAKLFIIMNLLLINLWHYISKHTCTCIDESMREEIEQNSSA